MLNGSTPSSHNRPIATQPPVTSTPPLPTQSNNSYQSPMNINNYTNNQATEDKHVRFLRREIKSHRKI